MQTKHTLSSIIDWPESPSSASWPYQAKISRQRALEGQGSLMRIMALDTNP